MVPEETVRTLVSSRPLLFASTNTVRPATLGSYDSCDWLPFQSSNSRPVIDTVVAVAFRLMV